MGVAFWSFVVYTVLFIGTYFGWAFYANKKEDEGE